MKIKNFIVAMGLIAVAATASMAQVGGGQGQNTYPAGFEHMFQPDGFGKYIHIGDVATGRDMFVPASMGGMFDFPYIPVGGTMQVLANPIFGIDGYWIDYVWYPWDPNDQFYAQLLEDSANEAENAWNLDLNTSITCYENLLAQIPSVGFVTDQDFADCFGIDLSLNDIGFFDDCSFAEDPFWMFDCSGLANSYNTAIGISTQDVYVPGPPGHNFNCFFGYGCSGGHQNPVTIVTPLNYGNLDQASVGAVKMLVARLKAVQFGMWLDINDPNVSVNSVQAIRSDLAMTAWRSFFTELHAAYDAS